jgi:hypothetical protein
LEDEGVASIYSMPFMYYTTFWSDDAQAAIAEDIRHSDRLDAVIMSGYTLFEKWKELLQARLKKRKSVHFMVPDPDSEIFCAIQKSWGLDTKQLDARKDRVRKAKQNMEELFNAERALLTEEEREQFKKRKTTWEVKYYDECPFYSFYLFDDKVYLAQYPFIRPSVLASPVYVFFRSSPEYQRIDNEWGGLQALIAQTST